MSGDPKARENKQRPVCRYCGSTEILRDAWASWDPDQQEWVLEAIFDFFHCNRCGGETKFVNFAVIPPEA